MSVKLSFAALPAPALDKIFTYIGTGRSCEKKGMSPLEHAMNAIFKLQEIREAAFSYACVGKVSKGFSVPLVRKVLLNLKKLHNKILDAHTTEDFLIGCIREKNFSLFKASVERHEAKGLSINATGLLSGEICRLKDDPLLIPFVRLLLEKKADPEYSSSRSMAAVALAGDSHPMLRSELQAFIAAKRALFK